MPPGQEILTGPCDGEVIMPHDTDLAMPRARDARGGGCKQRPTVARFSALAIEAILKHPSLGGSLIRGYEGFRAMV